MKRYSLAHLLSKQPKSIQKHPYYREMIHHFRLSPQLRKVRFSRRCYSLLLHAKIAPENLRYFYRTYRLPKDPFFPLYFAIKREYLEQKRKRKEAKIRYIAVQMRALPVSTLSFIKFLALLEQHYNNGNKSPIWNSELFPTTKKRVKELHRYSPRQWNSFFTEHLSRLSKRYKSLSPDEIEKILACYRLDALPSLPKPVKNRNTVPGGIKVPDKAAVVKKYRIMSKLFHPDRGGDGEMFVLLQEAKNILLGRKM